MRITMQSMYNNILTNLNNITTDMNRINTQISSGKQISTISENPVGAVTALGFRTSLSQITQYQSNLSFGDKTINAAEDALTQMKDIVSRAKVLGLQAANGSMSPDDRANAAKEVQNLFESAITLANTSVNGKYIFGGFRTTGYSAAEPAPFIQDVRDGYFVNGGRMPDSSTTNLTGTIGNTNLASGDVLINGVNIGAVTLNGGLTNGLNMGGAVNVANAINDQTVISQTGVIDTLTSPYAGVPATGTTANSRVAFYLNGTLVDTNTVPANNLLAGDSASTVSQKIANAVNAAFPTGAVTATVGTGANGGQANALILSSNDGSPMTITGLNPTEKAISGLSNNKATEGVSANLTTLYAGAAATTEGGNGGETMTQSINGISFNVSVVNGATAAQVATATVNAVNAVSARTGVSARIGDGTNGGALNSVVLYNTLAGDQSDIVVGALTNTNADTGLAAGTYSIDATHNTGTISLASTSAFTISTSHASPPLGPDDSILNLLGLGGGLKGFADNAGDGVLRYGSALTTGDFTVNGVAVTTSADGISDVYQDISAAAKAAAVNAKTSQTGVSATLVPASITAVSAVNSGTEATKLVGTPQNNGIVAGDLAINGVALGIINNGAATNGLAMAMASNAKQAINAASASSGVTASLTTLYASGAATAGANSVSFSLNGVPISYNTTGLTATAATDDAVVAINNASTQTGVKAIPGDGTNGGAPGSIVLYNALPGDESNITIANYTESGPGTSGLANINQVADATHNTGKIAFSSATPFQISSPNNLADDTILNELGLGGGESSTGIAGDIANDGVLNYGSTPTYLGPGDLVLNGVDIFIPPTSIVANDGDNALINAINTKTDQTGVKAGRDAAGHLLLTAVDGRNLHIQTSALGQSVTELSPSSGPQDQIYFGQVSLQGGDTYFLESATPTVGAITSYETGFAALGLTGGEAITGQSGDIASDGKIFVNKINADTGYVRYVGDRTNDLSVNVGTGSTLDVAKNGQTAVMDTGLFSVLKQLQDSFNGENYTTLTGAAQATDTAALLNSGKTGLPLESDLQNGSFTIAVTSHDTSPPTALSTVAINVDITKDSLADIASRINGIPGLSASWSVDGHLQINSNDPTRYTFNISDDTSNFLKATGSETDNLQVSNISDSLSKLDNLMQSLTTQISDFGAKSNRIVVQQQIYQNLSLSTTSNLSETEDTDMTKALMEINGKQTAYQAALSAAAKIMQMSLVDFLK